MRFRHGVELDGDAVGLGELLLVFAGAHALGPAAIDDGDVLGAETLRLGGDVDGGHAAADHDDAAADRQRGEVARLAQAGDVVDGVLDAGNVLVGEAEGVDAGKADAEEDRVEILAAARRG